MSTAPVPSQPVKLPTSGLIAVGFDATESYLLIVSHNGRVVYRTADWSRAARNAEPSDPTDRADPNQMPAVLGIGPLARQHIPVTLFVGSEVRLASPSGRYTLRCTASGVEVLGG